MWKYLKEAFWFRPHLGGLGALPVNLIALVCFLILALGHVGFLFLGTGLEILYLFLLATNSRFQRLVDSRQSFADRSRPGATPGRRETLLPEAQRRYSQLEQQSQHISKMYREAAASRLAETANLEGLNKLTTSYLELLLAEQRILSLERGETAARKLRESIRQLQQELEDADISTALRDAKTVTLGTLEKRLHNLRRREEVLKEIASYLQQIEQEMQLALEQASLHGQPETVSFDLDVARFMLEERFIGAISSAGESRPHRPLVKN